MSATVRWPRLLNPTQLATLIRSQKNPIAALHLFETAPLLYPTTYRHTPVVLSALLSSLLPHHPHLLPPHLPSPSPSPNDPISLLRNPNTSKLTLPSLNLIIQSLFHLSRPDLALDVFAELNHLCCSPDRHTYRILARGLVHSKRLDDAIHLVYSMLRRISQKGLEADVVVYRLVVEALCEEGRVGEAEDLLRKVLLKGLRSPRKRRGFRNVELKGLELEEMKRRIDAALVVGGVKSLRTYAAVIGDLYDEGKIENAGEMFDEMAEKGFRPTVAMYETKIGALCREGRLGDAVRVLEVEMKERGCVPSVKAYNLVMEGLCEERKSMKAVEYLERMERQVGCGARKESFEIVVKGLMREEKFVEAAWVLEKMARRKYWAGGEVYGGVVKGLCCVGRRYEALLWLEEMVSQAKVPGVSVWSSLVSMVCRDYDDSDEAVSFLDTLIDGCE